MKDVGLQTDAELRFNRKDLIEAIKCAAELAQGYDERSPKRRKLSQYLDEQHDVLREMRHRGLDTTKLPETRSNPGVRTWGRAITKDNLLNAFEGNPYDVTTAEAHQLVKLYKDKSVKVDAFMEEANAVLLGAGVTAIFGKYVNSYYQDCVALYVNTGDTYEPTILYDTVAGEFGITTMGDFVEVMSDEYEIS